MGERKTFIKSREPSGSLTLSELNLTQDEVYGEQLSQLINDFKTWTATQDPNWGIDIPQKQYAHAYATPKSCKRGYQFGKYLGRGSTSNAYITCDSDNQYVDSKHGKDINNPNKCDKVTIVRHIMETEGIRDFLETARFTKKMGEIGVGPKVYDYWICGPSLYGVFLDYESGFGERGDELMPARYDYRIGDLGYIVMDRLDINVADYITKKSQDRLADIKRVVKNVDQLLNKMYKETGYLHNDIGAHNIMVKGDRVYLIDFDSRKPYDEYPQEKIDSVLDSLANSLERY